MSKIMISELEATTQAPDSSYIAIDDGTTTNKITVANFNSNANATAKYYAEQSESFASTASGASSDATAAKNATEAFVGTASNYANAASTSASAAAGSATEASGYVGTARTYASNAQASAQAAAASAAGIEDQVKLAKSWAVGNTGARGDEATNNARYWSQVAQAAAGGGVTTFNGRSGVVNPESGDYSSDMITHVNTDDTTSNVQTEINNLKEIAPAPTSGEADKFLRGNGTWDIPIAGSYVTITTDESSLYSKDVTITDGTNTATAQFNNEGVAEFNALPYVGSLNIASTDGVDTARATVTIPYFGRYTYEISFWNAYVNISGGTELAGAVVTVTNSEESVVGTVTLNASGEGQFNAKGPDTYTFTTTYGSDTVTAEVEVTAEETYSVSLIVGWARWVTLGGLDPSDYSSLADVLADEPAVRRLMTIHASCDYLITQVTNDITVLNDFVANDTAMKWIGLRDYICDGLTAITGVEALFMASAYWERYLKDHVPVMTSNTAPYGTAGGSTVYQQNDYYKAFDGNDSTAWGASTTAYPQYLQYRFKTPICVKKFYMKINGADRVATYKIRASNDGSTWTDVTPTLTATYAEGGEWANIENHNYYLYYQLYCITGNLTANLNTVQFYGRSLNVRIPTMTSNTAPFGTAAASSSYSTMLPWKVFDDSNTDGNDCWFTQSGVNSWIGYTFSSDIVVKNFVAVTRNISSDIKAPKTYKIQASNDGFVNDIHDLTDVITNSTNTQNAVFARTNIDNTSAYKSYRMLILSTYASNNDVSVGKLQFYGVDYSEREFATGSTIKYLYDHGVELETLTAKTVGTGSVAEKRDTELYAIIPASTQRFATFVANNSIDFTNYNLVRMATGDELFKTLATDAYFAAYITNTSDPTYSSDLVSYGEIRSTSENIPGNEYLDVSALDTSYYLSVGIINNANASNRGGEICELWLE